MVERPITIIDTIGLREAVTVAAGETYRIEQDPSPGVVVGLGEYDIKISVFDSQGLLVGNCVSGVRVVDNSKMTINCPSDLSVECTRPEGANVFWEEPIAMSEGCKTSGKIDCSHKPGDLFPVGTTIVTCTSSDASGELVTCSFKVTVNCKDDVIPENPRISINTSVETGLTLDWGEGGQLEVADSPVGPWRPVLESKSGIKVQTTGSQSFYRVRY